MAANWRVGVLSAFVLASCIPASGAQGAATSESNPPQPSPQCREFQELGPEAARYRVNGDEARIYLHAVEPGSDLPDWDLVLVVPLPDTEFGSSLGTSAPSYVALAGWQGCLQGHKFIDPVQHLAAVSKVNRHRKGMDVSAAVLQADAAAGDSEAQALLGIAEATNHSDRRGGAGWNLVVGAARQFNGLATLTLGYWQSGLGEMYPPGQGPAFDRAAAFCWLNAAAQSSDTAIGSLARVLLQDLERELSRRERDDGLKRWKRIRTNRPPVSCQ